MKFSSVFLPLLCATAVSANGYISEGWAPGKPVNKGGVPTGVQNPNQVPRPTATGPRPAFTDQVKTLLDPLSWLQTDLARGTLEKFGINITDRLEAARLADANLWSPDIPLITDDNYVELVVNETLTAQEERERLWVLIITVTAGQKEGISRMLDGVFDETYNATKAAGDLTHVKWGRIDYLNVTAITTRWNIWQGPYLVFITDRGQTLRFMKANRIRLSSEAMREFLLSDGYLQIPPWESDYGPGGDKEWIMIYFAEFLRIVYDKLILIPKWLLLVISGAIGSGAMSLMHKSEEKKLAAKAAAAAAAAPRAPKAPAVTPAKKPEAASNTGSNTATPSTKKPASKKKGGKK